MSAGFAQEKKNAAIVPVDKKDAGWVKRHESFVERAKKGDVDVLFVSKATVDKAPNKFNRRWRPRARG